MRQEDLERRLRETRVPGEDEAASRSWEVVRRALGTGGTGARRASPRLAFALTALAALALALTPAGAKVGDLIDDVTGGSDPRPGLSKIPGGGELLVSSRQGPWLVQADGSKRLLGDYERATFSPNGLFVAVTDRRELIAVEPNGEPRWTITAPARVRQPLWSPSGFRIAYGAGEQLRVVAGDGTGDRRLAIGGPAGWRPPSAAPTGAGSREVLAYATPGGRIVAIDADSRKALWRSEPGTPVGELAWTGRDLVVVVRSGAIELLDGRDGAPLRVLAQPRGTTVTSLARSPDGRRLAFVRSDAARGGSSELVLVRLGEDGVRSRTVFSTPGPAQLGEAVFSPDGKRLLLAWREADQWLFIRPDRDEKQLGGVEAVGDIAAQFDPGATGPSPPPVIEGWCCRFADDS